MANRVAGGFIYSFNKYLLSTKQGAGEIIVSKTDVVPAESLETLAIINMWFMLPLSPHSKVYPHPQAQGSKLVTGDISWPDTMQ